MGVSVDVAVSVGDGVGVLVGRGVLANVEVGMIVGVSGSSNCKLRPATGNVIFGLGLSNLCSITPALATNNPPMTVPVKIDHG